MGDGGASKVGWRLAGFCNVSSIDKLSKRAVSTEKVEDCNIGFAGKNYEFYIHRN